MTAALIPFMNKLLPAWLALKGIAKLNPKLGNFIQKSVGTGIAAEHVLDYVRGRVMPPGDSAERERLESGSLTPQEKSALGKRKQEGALGTAIGTGIGLATGLGGLMGGSAPEAEERTIETGPRVKPPSQKAKGQAVQKFNERKKKNAMVDELHQQFQQHYGAQQQQGQPQQLQQQQQQAAQQGNSDDMLLAALQKILQM